MKYGNVKEKAGEPYILAPGKRIWVDT